VEKSSLSAQKKTTDAIQQEVAREVEQLLRTILTGLRKTGQLDLEAIEMSVRSAMHQAGAIAFSELLQFPVPEKRPPVCLWAGGILREASNERSIARCNWTCR
jgi:hypothetical protein